MNDNEDRTYQNVWNAAKAAPQKKCIALNTHIRKENPRSMT